MKKWNIEKVKNKNIAKIEKVENWKKIVKKWKLKRWKSEKVNRWKIKKVKNLKSGHWDLKNLRSKILKIQRSEKMKSKRL